MPRQPRQPRVPSEPSSHSCRYSPLSRGTSAPIKHDSGTTLNVDHGNTYCEECDKEFSRPSELKRHLKQTLIHNPGAKQFQCRFCNSSHTQKANLKTHERIHLNELKERCGLPLAFGSSEECNFLCSDPSSMTRHINKMHMKTPFTDKGLLVPDWLHRAMRKREMAKQVTRRTATASPRVPSPNWSTASLAGSSGSFPLTPSPFAGTSRRRTPNMSKLAVPDYMDVMAVSKLNMTNNYISPQHGSPYLTKRNSSHFDYSPGHEHPGTHLSPQGVQDMTSSALFSQPPVHETAAYSNSPQVNMDFHLMGYDQRGLPLAPLAFDDIAPFLHPSRGSHSVPPGPLPHGSTSLHVNTTFMDNSDSVYYNLSSLDSSSAGQEVHLDLSSFS